MLQFPPWKQAIVLGLVLLGLLFSLPNFAGGRALPGFLPQASINLGLDLRGGSYLLLEVDPEELKTNRLRELSRDVAEALLDPPGRVRFQNRQVVGDSVRVRIVDPDDISEARRRIEDLANPVGGLGGPNSLTVRENGGILSVSFSDAQLQELEREALTNSIEVIRRRIDGSGTTDPNIQRQGDNRIVLEVPGVDDPAQLIDIITRSGVMTLNLVDEEADHASYEYNVPRLGKVKRAGAVNSETGIAEPDEVVFEDPIVTGRDFASAGLGYEENGNPRVDFTLNGAGARKFGKFTSDHVGSRFAIILDDEVISAPRVRSAILGGSGVITGRFTAREAESIGVVLEAGELPAKLKVVEQRVVGAGLGEDSIRAGATASILGLILVAVFMMLAYGLIGSFAVVSLGANILMILGVLSGLGATLTLPGIAGIILTIGMAVDANVLVFERVREEARGGRSPVTAVEAGYERALSTILDANITTLIAAAVLFQMGSGPVKGFAVTLGVGVLTSVFTAFVLTRLFMSVWLRAARPKKLPV